MSGATRTASEVAALARERGRTCTDIRWGRSVGRHAAMGRCADEHAFRPGAGKPDPSSPSRSDCEPRPGQAPPSVRTSQGQHALLHGVGDVERHPRLREVAHLRMQRVGPIRSRVPLATMAMGGQTCPTVGEPDAVSRPTPLQVREEGLYVVLVASEVTNASSPSSKMVICNPADVNTSVASLRSAGSLSMTTILRNVLAGSSRARRPPRHVGLSGDGRLGFPYSPSATTNRVVLRVDRLVRLQRKT